MKYFVKVDGKEHVVELRERLGELSVKVDGESLPVSYSEIDGRGHAHLRVGLESHAVTVEEEDERLYVNLDGHAFAVEIEDERERAAHAAERAGGAGGGVLKSVMPGVVIELLVAEGDSIEAGQPLLLLEAMKMQNEIASNSAGIVDGLHVGVGEAVRAGQRLVSLRSLDDGD